MLGGTGGSAGTGGLVTGGNAQAEIVIAAESGSDATGLVKEVRGLGLNMELLDAVEDDGEDTPYAAE